MNNKNQNPQGFQVIWLNAIEGVKNKKISVLAAFETLFAIYCAIWVIPEWTGNFLHLTFFGALVPFMLLRSQRSNDMALDNFETYFYQENDDIPLITEKGISIIVLSTLLNYFVISALLESWLLDYTYDGGWPMIWRAGVIGWIAINLGFGVVISGSVTEAGTLTGVVTGIGVIIIIVLFKDLNSSAVFAAGGVATFVAIALVLVENLTLIIVGWGLLFGLLLRSCFERFRGTLFNLKAGFSEVANNWRQLTLVQDFRYPPEILPGSNLREYMGLNFMFLLKGAEEQGHSFKNTLKIILCSIMYLPAICLRLCLKATALFYFPFYLGINFGNKKKESDEQLLRRYSFSASNYASWNRLLLGLILSLPILSLWFPNFLEEWRVSAHDSQLPHFLLFSFYPNILRNFPQLTLLVPAGILSIFYLFLFALVHTKYDQLENDTQFSAVLGILVKIHHLFLYGALLLVMLVYANALESSLIPNIIHSLSQWLSDHYFSIFIRPL